jgi:sucrose-6-phosphate hydrolase SacC (GH32 family)
MLGAGPTRMLAAAAMSTVWCSQPAAASGSSVVDDSAPIFHVGPAGCRGGVAPLHHGHTNDPNGPFEYKGVHHIFYQSRGSATVWSKGDTYWGHAAGNLSHWHCMPPAIAPGIDYSDGSQTAYDSGGIFTGSVTIMNGVPIATYPGEGGDHWCDATPANLSDPLLTIWQKKVSLPGGLSWGNPMGNDGTLHTTGGPLGCTAAWKEPSGNWTTTIQSTQLLPGCLGKKPACPIKTAFFTSSNFRNWSWIGDLDCPECDQHTQPCSDFFPVQCSSPDCAQPPSGNRWVFGINGGGGALTGVFNRKTLKLTPDRPNVHTNTYGNGMGAYPKTYVTSDGRRVFYRW